MTVLLIARWDGDVDALKSAYDKAHRLIMERGGPPGELRHHCAIGDDALYIIGVWESEEGVRARFESAEFEELLTSVGFPSPKRPIRRSSSCTPSSLRCERPRHIDAGEAVAPRHVRFALSGEPGGRLRSLDDRVRRALT